MNFTHGFIVSSVLLGLLVLMLVDSASFFFFFLSGLLDEHWFHMLRQRFLFLLGVNFFKGL